MQLDDDLTATFVGAREQDNEQIEFETRLAEENAKAAELDMQSMAQNMQQKAVESPVTQDKAQDAPTPSEGVEMPTELPSAEGEMEPFKGETVDVEMDVVDYLSEAPRVIGDIVTGLPKNITVGTVDAAKQAFDAVAPGFLSSADNSLVDMGFGDYVESVNNFFGEAKAAGGADRTVQEITQFAVPFSMWMKGLGAVSQAGTFTKAMTADALTSYFNLDPHMDRLSKAFAEMGLQNELVSYLASDEGSDSENRFRNVIENQAMGAAIGGSIYGMVKSFKGMMWAGRGLKKHYDEVGAEDFFLGPKELREAGAVGDLSNRMFAGESDEWARAEAKGLAMDKTSRMDRAHQMGFDTESEWYHGTARDGYVTSTDIKAFDPEKIGDRWRADEKGYFFTNDQKEANYYSMSERDFPTRGSGEGAVYPVVLRNENPLIIDDAFLKKQGMAPIGEVEDTVGFWDNYQGLIHDWVEDGGHDSVVLIDNSRRVQNGQPRKMAVMFDNTAIRSRNAAFDPANKGSALIASGVAGVAAIDAKKSKGVK